MSDPAKDDPILELAGAGFRHRDAQESALAGIDLVIRPGEMVAALGPQSSGTSTLCRLAAGLLEDRGTVTGLISRPRGQRAGVVMLGDDPEAQETGMTSFVRDEVRLPGRLLGLPAGDDGRADAALAALGVEHLADRRLDSLSGGERQLVALAGLMALRPALLVLDQPGLSLDPGARARLLRALQEHCASGGAVLLAGHQQDELSAACGSVHFLEAGRLGPASGSGQAVDADSTVSPEQFAEAGVWSSLPAGAPRPEPRPAPGPTPGSAPRPAPQMCRNCGNSPAREVHSCSFDTSGEKTVPLLTAADLTVSRGGRTVLDRTGLCLRSGEILTLRGPNGSGKSTLLKALAGLLEKDAKVTSTLRAGTLETPDADLMPLPAHARAHRIAWVGQDPGAQLSASTVRAELERAAPLSGPGGRRPGRRERRRLRAERAGVVVELMERTGLSAVAQEHPYDLSPARRKDLVIATALLLRPQVLLLDEPTLGRDLDGMRRLSTLLRSFAGSGGAVLAATHDHAWAEEISLRSITLPHHPDERTI